jgi:hypothetical protein
MKIRFGEARRSHGVTAVFAALGASILWCAGAKADSPLLPACDPTSVRYDIIQCDETFGLNNLGKSPGVVGFRGLRPAGL